MLVVAQRGVVFSRFLIQTGPALYVLCAAEPCDASAPTALMFGSGSFGSGLGNSNFENGIHFLINSNPSSIDVDSRLIALSSIHRLINQFFG